MRGGPTWRNDGTHGRIRPGTGAREDGATLRSRASGDCRGCPGSLGEIVDEAIKGSVQRWLTVKDRIV